MKTALQNIHTNRIAFIALIGVSVFSIVYYVYAVHMTVRNVALRQEKESTLSQLKGTIGELEFAYIARKNTVDMHLATELGFMPVEKQTFVSRRGGSVAFLGSINQSR